MFQVNGAFVGKPTHFGLFRLTVRKQCVFLSCLKVFSKCKCSFLELKLHPLDAVECNLLIDIDKLT